MTNTTINNIDMITQNPIIGRAKNKLGGVYARTLYGKNILQTCPPPTKGHQTPNQVAVCKAFGMISQLANQISPSVLNQIYYAAPQGRSRRAQWNKDLAKGMVKEGAEWLFDPSSIPTLGSNTKVSTAPLILNVTETQFDISFEALSATSQADVTKTPCLILICPETRICIPLISYTTVTDDAVHLQHLSTTLLQKECWIFPLWQTNVGTQQTPIYAYGSYQKDII